MLCISFVHLSGAAASRGFDSSPWAQKRKYATFISFHLRSNEKYCIIYNIGVQKTGVGKGCHKKVIFFCGPATKKITFFEAKKKWKKSGH